MKAKIISTEANLAVKVSLDVSVEALKLASSDARTLKNSDGRPVFVMAYSENISCTKNGISTNAKSFIINVVTDDVEEAKKDVKLDLGVILANAAKVEKQISKEYDEILKQAEAVVVEE